MRNFEKTGKAKSRLTTTDNEWRKPDGKSRNLRKQIRNAKRVDHE
jgi:ribosomal protein L32E